MTYRRGVDPARLLDVLQASGLSYRVGTESFKFRCPLCNKPDKLYIRKSDGRFICWFCAKSRGFEGAPEFALKELTGRSIADLRKDLYGSEPVQAGQLFVLKFDGFGEPDELEEDGVAMPEEPPDVGWEYHHVPIDKPAAAPGREYLENQRGVSVELAREYGLRYAVRDRRVLFPVRMGKSLVGWQGRLIDPPKRALDDGTVLEDLPYLTGGALTGAGGWRDRCVMFAHRVEGDHVVLCEGPFDALKAHLVGGNVATMGKGVADRQVDLVVRSGVRRVYLALDPDAAAEIPRLVDKFTEADVEVRLVTVPGKDLGELSLEAARDAVLAAPLVRRDQVFVHFDTRGLPPLAARPRAS